MNGHRCWLSCGLLLLALALPAGAENPPISLKVENATAAQAVAALAKAAKWAGTVSLPGPLPGAKRLAWVEGELLAYRLDRCHRIEIPLPRAEEGAGQECDGTVVEITRFDPGAPAAGGGRWVNEEIEVDLAAGKEAKLPPLRWTGAAAGPRQ